MLTQLKKLELADDPTMDGDEYLDAFVALGGGSNKEGSVEKSTLIEIIKEQFELTIDMVVSATIYGGNAFLFYRNTYARLAEITRVSTTTSSACCSMRARAATHHE